MGATRNTGYIENLIAYDGNNNIGVGGPVNVLYKVTIGGNTLVSGNLNVTGTITFSSNVTANSFVKNGGVATEFLKADGTVDTSTYATVSYVDTSISNLIDAAPAALNTLNELAAALGDDSSFSTTVTTALGNRLRIDTDAQGLTSEQKANGRTNLGVVIGTDVQAYDADLGAIAALTGTSGLLKKTAANTWTLDTNTYLTSYTETDTLQSVISRGAISNTGITITNANGTYSTPASTNVPLVYLYNTGTTGTSNAVLSLRTNTATGGDPILSFDIGGVQGWSMGIDNSDSDKFKIAQTWNALDSSTRFSMQTDGTANFTGNLTAANLSGTNTGDQDLSGYQPIDADLTAIAALSGTSGFLKKTAANTWSLDTNTYLTSYTETDTLATVTGRGASTTTAISINSASVDHVTLANRFHFIGSSNFHITNNAYYNAAFKYQTAAAANKITIQSDGNFLFDYAASGTIDTNITWTTVFSVTNAGVATASSFVKSGGTSSQFLKADGSVDSTTYQAALTNPVTGTGTTNRIAYWNSVNSIAALDTASYPTLTELSYVKGVTSAIQTQINAITANYVTTNTTQEITVVKTFKSDDAAGLHFKNAAGTFVGALSTYKQWFSGGTSTDLALGAKANLYLFSNDGSNWAVKIDTNRDAIFASKVKIDGGTSSQFLKANGDLDSNTYLTAESDTLATVTGRGASTSSDVSFGATTGANRGIQIQYGNTLNDYGRIRFYQNGVNHSTIHSFSSTWGNGFVSQSRGAINIQGQNGVTFGPWDNPDVTFANTGDISLIKTTNIGHNGATPSSATGWNGSSVARLQSGSTGGNVYLEFRTRADVGDYAGLIFTDNNNGGYIAWRNYVGAGANDGTNGDYMLYGTYTDHIFQAGSSNAINGKPEVFRMYANGNARVMQHFYIPSGTLYMKDSGPSIYENRINAGWNSTGDAIDMWINYEGYQNSNGYFRDFRVGNGKRGSAIMFIDGSEGTTAFSGQVTLNGPLVVDYSNAYLWVKSVNSGSGMQWHDQIWLGRYDRIQTAAQYPNYLPGVAYGIHITQTSDAAFFGLIDRGSAYNSYNCVIAWGDDAPEDVFQYRFNNNVIGTITPSGALTMSSDITAFSDIRIKENITTIDNALEKVLKLRGVYYNRTDLKFDKSKKVGFIAQEVQDVIPEIVTYDEQIDRYAVTYGNTVAILVEAIKEQQKQIEELKSQIKNK